LERKSFEAKPLKISLTAKDLRENSPQNFEYQQKKSLDFVYEIIQFSKSVISKQGALLHLFSTKLVQKGFFFFFWRGKFR